MQPPRCCHSLWTFASVIAALIAVPAGATETLAGGAATVCREGKVEMIIGGTQPVSACNSPSRAPAPSAGRTSMTSVRVSDAEQRQRDQDRRVILENELQRERQALADQLRPGSGADEAAVNRTRSNLAALQRELGRHDL